MFSSQQIVFICFSATSVGKRKLSSCICFLFEHNFQQDCGVVLKIAALFNNVVTLGPYIVNYTFCCFFNVLNIFLGVLDPWANYGDKVVAILYVSQIAFAFRNHRCAKTLIPTLLVVEGLCRKQEF